MSRRYSDAGIAVGLGAAFLMVFLVGWWVADYDANEARNAYHRAEQSADDPDSERYKPCFTMLARSPDATFKCVVDEAKASREAQTSEYDLAAQESMADSATRLIIVTVVLSMVGFGLTGVGIVFVWRTLRATRNGNKIARKIGQAQIRAYVSLTNYQLVDHTPNVKIDIEFTNTGQTPARKARFRTEFLGEEPKDLIVGYDESVEYSVFEIGAGKHHPTPVNTDSFAGAFRQAVYEGRATAWLRGLVEYDDVFGKRRYTWFKLKITGNGKGQMIVSPTRDGNEST